MGRDGERDDRRRDHRHRNRSRDRSRDRRRSRSRSPAVHGRGSGPRRDRSRDRSRDQSRDESRERSRERSCERSRDQSRDRSRERSRDDQRRDSRHDRDADRDRRRDKNRKRNLSPKKNKFFERAQKLGIATGIPAIVDTPTSSELPILNPVSTSRIVDQIKQRKLLWSKPAEAGESSGTCTPAASGAPTTAAAAPETSGKNKPAQEDTKPRSGSMQHWAKATFRGDDGSMSAKFRKLMGIKEADVSGKPTGGGEDVLAEQDKLFRQLDQEYQKARQSTHTQRGMGLGWGH